MIPVELSHVSSGSLSLSLSRYWNVLSNGMARTMFSIHATHGRQENRELLRTEGRLSRSVLIHEGARALKVAVNAGNKNVPISHSLASRLIL